MSVDPKNTPTSAKLPEGTRVGIVVSRYHLDITGSMLNSAKRELASAGVSEDQLVIASAPGAFELPFLAQELAVRSDIDAVICFGLVLKGETDHDRYISQATANAIMDISLRLAVPILFGVLTCSTVEQAIARSTSAADGGKLDKGREVARAAIEVLLSAYEIRKNAPGL
ncbi:MAG: 6,7-dimethyl-8-ribityllumazine synthase [Planctomycetota bacterium]|jgi:6,7-dimethyl-8-ribityllumazine synthase